MNGTSALGAFYRSDTYRCTVSQELTEILGTLKTSHMRYVQVLVPQSPQVFVIIDPPQEDLMTNKSYRWPVFHPGATVKFLLGPSQTIAAACADGNAQITLVVESFESQREAMR